MTPCNGELIEAEAVISPGLFGDFTRSDIESLA